MAVSRKLVALSGAAGFALFALTGAALADGYEGSIKDAPAKPEREFTYSFSLTGTSDYVFRGVSQNDNDPTIQGAINVGYGIAYAGIWASGIDWSTDPKAQVEIDYYGGIKPTWGKATFDFGVIYYTYPGTAKVAGAGFGDTSILELKAGVSGEILPKLTAGATFYYAPDYNNFDYGVIEGTLAYALPKTWIFDPTISGTYGYQDSYGSLRVTDYSYWNAGLTLTVDKLAFDFRYWDTDLSTSDCSTFAFGGNTCGERFVFTLTATLP